MSLAILVPVLRRPHRVKPLLDSIKAATPEPHAVYFLADPGDHGQLDAILEDGRHEPPIFVTGGNFAEKINRGVRLTDEPLLFLGADDLHFHSGWLEAATAKLADGIGVVGTNDLCNRRVIRGQHSTHSLVTRAYADLGLADGKPGLLCEEYPHEWCDDELVATAKHRGAFAHAADAIVEHLHPMVGKAPMDDLYAGQRDRMREGRRIFNRRQHLWN